MTIEEKLKKLPDKPGVYIMYDAAGTVIYVGKAVLLTRRVRQYFNHSPKPAKVQAMVDNVADLEYIITLNEKDALSLEANLIKKYNPHYNILLKDDKASPYIKIDRRDDFPTIEVTRKLKKDGARYFGPYFNGLRVWDIVAIIRSCYGVRTCKRALPKKLCLNYHLKLCCAPCAGRVTKEEYNERLEKVVAFLSGREEGAAEIIQKRMLDAAAMEQFESAIAFRDQLNMLKLLKERSVANLGKIVDIDAFSFVSSGFFGAAAVNIVRGGKMMGVKNYFISDASLSTEETLTSFISQYYMGNHDFPDEICLPFLPSNGLKEYITALKGRSVAVTCPQKGEKKKLVEMSERNAADYLDRSVENERHRYEMGRGAAERLKKLLGLNKLERMECFDISHISGTDKVASGVVFINGEPAKSEYRRYKIKTVEGSDDFACMNEVIGRRLKKSEGCKLPDLIVIDGGKGQLSAAMAAMKDCGAEIPMVGLAERDEEIYTPFVAKPITLTKSDYALKLLQRIRDEAHRFAITYHRNLRNKRMVAGLEKIKGVGEAKRKLLHDKFTPEELKTADEEQLKKAGIDKKTAAEIVKYFRSRLTEEPS